MTSSNAVLSREEANHHAGTFGPVASLYYASSSLDKLVDAGIDAGLTNDRTLVSRMNVARNDAARLRRMANELQQQAIGQRDACDDEIAGLIRDLRRVSHTGNLMLIAPERAARIADALLIEGSDAAERMTQAGLAAAEWQRRALDAEARQTTLHSVIGDLCDSLDEANQQHDAPAARVAVLLQIAPADADGGISPELASDLALLLTDLLDDATT